MIYLTRPILTGIDYLKSFARTNNVSMEYPPPRCPISVDWPISFPLQFDLSQDWLSSLLTVYSLTLGNLRSHDFIVCMLMLLTSVFLTPMCPFLSRTVCELPMVSFHWDIHCECQVCDMCFTGSLDMHHFPAPIKYVLPQYSSLPEWLTPQTPSGSR